MTIALAPVSGGEFPANREFNREFSQKWPSGAIFGQNFPLVFSRLHAKFPTRNNREFFRGEQGICRAEQGIQAPPEHVA
jgi:hypothetical protein